MGAKENWLRVAPSGVWTLGFSWPLIIAITALLGVLGSNRFELLLADPDTYWHVSTGRWIIEHASVPQLDLFSHSMSGAPWTAHEWLSEVLLARVHEAAGWSGLVVLVALMFAGTLAYLLRFLLGRMEPAHALLFTAFAAAMLMGHLLARPHVLVWPLLAVWVGTLVNAGEQRRSPPWWLLALIVFWANLHGSFTLALALGAALALEAVLNCPIESRRAAAAQWAGFVMLAVLAALITPSGLEGLLYPIQVTSMTVALDVITEWRSPDFHKLQMLEIWLMLVLAIACAGRMRLPWMRLILVLGLAHLALKHQRHVAILGLLTPFLLATPLARQWHATRSARPDAESIDRVFVAFASPARWQAMAISALLALFLVATALRSERFVPPAVRTPEAAVAAATRAGATGPVLNAYGFGGYLIYRGMPVFIDGRADMYGDALLNRYLEALNLTDPEALPRLLADYHIGWTLLERGTPAVALLDRLPGWRRIHADDVAVVHVRDGGAGQ